MSFSYFHRELKELIASLCGANTNLTYTPPRNAIYSATAIVTCVQSKSQDEKSYVSKGTNANGVYVSVYGYGFYFSSVKNTPFSFFQSD